MHRSSSELDLHHYHDPVPRIQDKQQQQQQQQDDKKKRGRSPFRFFSRKRDAASSADRGKQLGKSRTPELDKSPRIGAGTGLNPQARSIGLSNSMLNRSPTIKHSQVLLNH